MKKSRAMLSLIVLCAAGCGQLRPVAPPIVLSQRTVTVSAEDPFITMEDGTRIPVDGVATGQPLRFVVTQTRDGQGNVSVDVHPVAEPIPKLEEPSRDSP